jgi:hypothetical protein
VGDEDGLAGFREEHGVGLPMAGGGAVAGFGGTVVDGLSLGEARGSAAFVAPAALEPSAQQVESPAAVAGAFELGVDEAVDGLVADNPAAGVEGEAAADLLGRPAVGHFFEDGLAQGVVAIEPRARPAPRRGLLLGVGGAVADLGALVAPQLPGDGRRLAIQSCSDLPDRLPAFMKAGNLTPFLDRELEIAGHGNTCLWCCTSFVNSEGPSSPLAGRIGTGC